VPTTRDPKDIVDQRFVESIVESLEKSFDAHEFGRLIIAAPPRLLGLLRRALRPPVARRVEFSLPRDSVKLGLHEVQRRIEILTRAGPTAD
jgi:protein required for attachment to host cells